MKKTATLFGAFILNIFIAPITLAQIADHIYTKQSEKTSKCWFYSTIFVPLFGSSISFFLLQMKFNWAWAIGFFGYLTFCACIATVRMHTRDKLNISGHIIEDFISSFLLYPSVVVQLKMTLDSTLRNDVNFKMHLSEI